MKSKRNLIILVISFIAAIILGSITISIYDADYFWQGLPGAVLLSFLSCIGLYAAWHIADKDKLVGWVMVVTFLLRLLLGVGFSTWLPQYGYDTDQQNGGYLFRDAYERDQESWGYSFNDESLYEAYQIGFDTDQYGGLVILGAVIYRGLSVDFHRSTLLIIISAFMAALTVPFLWKAIRKSWAQKIAALTVLIYAFYPDSILFASSQMREPYIFALSAIAFWAVQFWREHKVKSIIGFAICSLLMMFISEKVSLFIVAFLLVWFILMHFPPQKRTGKIIFLIGLLFGGLVLAVGSWGWLKISASWEVLVSVQNSGWVQKIVQDLGERWQFPFLTGYGLVQPLLPAAIVEPSILIWKSIAISRALGWYIILPFIVFGFFSIQLEKNENQRWFILWTAIFMAFWILLSSARAGGDLWDNPRYRLAFLPWISLFIAWAWYLAREARNGWLIRWIVLIWSFVLLITHWYIGRYIKWFAPLDLQVYFIAFAILGAVVVVQGIIQYFLDHKKKAATAKS